MSVWIGFNICSEKRNLDYSGRKGSELKRFRSWLITLLYEYETVTKSDYILLKYALRRWVWLLQTEIMYLYTNYYVVYVM